ncbi:amino acid transporter [Sphingomonas vulcanisoli]|uniref:Amino acid transporter n=1 Tax=Sphingomonas vulcanisoli TaxID=1658060 RepID=A0ABX0TQA8_9SPHN|nr:APC family permease [Sphingomonas vulcanisoli]NIJ07682.1 amino acid transporter [Sphingomonas vulcanisoli]
MTTAPPPLPKALPRCLGTLGMLFLTLSAISPASSVFIIVPGMLQGAGTGALWAMAIAGLVCLATAYVYAELSSAFPIAGGEYVMVARTLGPLPGFVMLVINVFNNMLFPPVVGLGVSAVLAHVIPGLPVVPIAIVVVAGATLCGLLNIRVNALVTGLFLVIELAALGLVTALGLIHPAQGLLPMLAHPVLPSLQPATMPATGTATTIGIFALNGYGMAVYFGEEMHDASTRIARVVMLSFAAAFLFELGPTIAALIGTPDLARTLSATDPFGDFVASWGGGLIAALMAVGVAIAILNAAIVTVLGSARFLYSTGRDRVWGGPVDRWIAAVHPRWHSPWVATLVNGALGIGCCFIKLNFLLILSGGGLLVTYCAISLGALAGRRTGSTNHGPYRMPLFPIAPILTLVALAYVAWTNWLDVDEGRPGLIATAAQIVAAILYYTLVLRRRGAWIVHDPAVETAERL